MSQTVTLFQDLQDAILLEQSLGGTENKENATLRVVRHNDTVLRLTVRAPGIHSACMLQKGSLTVVLHLDSPDVKGRCGPHEVAYQLCTYMMAIGTKYTIPLVNVIPVRLVPLDDKFILVFGKRHLSHHTLDITQPHYWHENPVSSVSKGTTTHDELSGLRKLDYVLWGQPPERLQPVCIEQTAGGDVSTDVISNIVVVGSTAYFVTWNGGSGRGCELNTVHEAARKPAGGVVVPLWTTVGQILMPSGLVAKPKEIVLAPCTLQGGGVQIMVLNDNTEVHLLRYSTDSPLGGDIATIKTWEKEVNASIHAVSYSLPLFAMCRGGQSKIVINAMDGAEIGVDDDSAKPIASVVLESVLLMLRAVLPPEFMIPLEYHLATVQNPNVNEKWLLLFKYFDVVPTTSMPSSPMVNFTLDPFIIGAAVPVRASVGDAETSKPLQTAPMPYVAVALVTLHVLHEAWIIEAHTVHNESTLSWFRQFLKGCAQKLGWGHYTRHYRITSSSLSQQQQQQQALSSKPYMLATNDVDAIRRVIQNYDEKLAGAFKPLDVFAWSASCARNKNALSSTLQPWPRLQLPASLLYHPAAATSPTYKALLASLTKLNELTDILWYSYGRVETPKRVDQEWYHTLAIAAHLHNWNRETIQTLSPGFREVFLEAFQKCKALPLSKWSGELYALIGRPDVGMQFMKTNALNIVRLPIEGTAVGRRFTRLLDSSSPCRIDNYDATMDVQAILRDNSKKVLGLCVGRGMLKLGTGHRKDSHITIPALMFNGIAGKLQLKFDISTGGDAAGAAPTGVPQGTSELKSAWADFHNACSAALELPYLDSYAFPRDWVQYQVMSVSNSVHRAGIFLALGLLGQCQPLAITDIHNFLSLKQRHDFSIIATLIGMCSTLKGTCDAKMTKCLAVHIQSVSPALDIDLSLDVQSSALVSLGLLYMQSAQRFYVEVLLGDLLRPPSDEHSAGREGYGVAAGFGLGFMLLGKGSKYNHTNVRIEDRLIAALNGTSREALRIVEDHSIGTFELLDLDQSRLSSRLRRPNRAAMPTCTRILESDHINAKVAGPGAAVALCLQYLKTNDPIIGNILLPPKTAELLDHLTTHQAMLRTLCGNLVLWNSIEGTTAWLRATLPPPILKVMTAPKDDAQEYDLWLLDFRPGGLKHLRNLCAFLNAGNVLSLGFRYVGSMRTDVRDVILAELKGYLTGNIGSFKLPVKGLTSVDSCIASCAIAAGLVMAGTLDATTLNVLRSAERTSAKTYGVHMAFGMAIGFLGLGGGTLSFDKSLSTLALLLASVYPLWPQGPVDNAQHLQALRHLYAAATVRRTLTTVDSATGKSVSVPILIILKPDVTSLTPPPPLHLKSPCLLPDPTEIDRMNVLGEAQGFFTLTLHQDDVHSWGQSVSMDRTLVLVKAHETTKAPPSSMSLSSSSPPFTPATVLLSSFGVCETTVQSAQNEALRMLASPGSHGDAQLRRDVIQLLSIPTEVTVALDQYFASPVKAESLVGLIREIHKAVKEGVMTLEAGGKLLALTAYDNRCK